MLDREKFDAWVEENGTGHVEHKYINGIDYTFATMKDGWIAIFEVDDGAYIPKMQAADEAHASGHWFISTCSKGLYWRPGRYPWPIFFLCDG